MVLRIRDDVRFGGVGSKSVRFLLLESPRVFLLRCQVERKCLGYHRLGWKEDRMRN